MNIIDKAIAKGKELYPQLGFNLKIYVKYDAGYYIAESDIEFFVDRTVIGFTAKDTKVYTLLNLDTIMSVQLLPRIYG